ncbi:MAG TPA: ubiquinol-cytochrome C chaperone family protein [Alphaproteobacteria bacterium]|nr:ubiquinol-cytochrome C chaperone family protein [Alphaproteobacteria bacterium]
MTGLLGRLAALWRRDRALSGKVDALYGALVAQSRRSEFYAKLGVPDSVDGRFDMIILHLSLLLRRLRGEDEALAQALLDITFDDMDRNLREMGAGDLGVGRRVKVMARAYFGRFKTYDTALEMGDGEALAEALARNVKPADGLAAARHIADYVVRVEASLAGQTVAALASSKICFPKVLTS